MRRCLIALLLTAALIVPAQAQLSVRFNPGLAAPVGEFGDVAQGGLGGYIGIDLGIRDNLALIATAGFVAFGETRFIDFTGFSEGELCGPPPVRWRVMCLGHVLPSCVVEGM